MCAAMASSSGSISRLCRPVISGMVCFFITLLIAAGPACSPLPPDIERIVKRGRLVVAVYREDMPPFFMKDTHGALTGIDVSLAKAIGRSLGVAVVFDRRADSFNSVVDVVARGEADIGISMLSVTLDRAQRVLFSHPYAYIRPAVLFNRLILARSQGRDPWQILQSAVVRVGMVRGSAYVAMAAERFPKATPVLFPDSDSLLTALKQNRVQAIFQSEAFIEKMLAEAPAISIFYRLLYVPGNNDRFACILPWTSIHFWKWLNTTMETLESSPAEVGRGRKYGRNYQKEASCDP